MEAVTTQFDFLKDLPQREEDWPSELRTEVNEYVEAFKEHEGLILRAAVPELLGVSRQRVDQLGKEYGFWKREFFDKTWYSRRELEDFYKLKRGKGTKKASVLKAAKAMLSDTD